jgi:HEAT repeat protein
LREDPALEVRAAAAISLGRFLLLGELGKIRARPYQEAFRALLSACTAARKEGEVRRRALESLAYSCKEAVVGLIRAAYEDPDEQMRLSAVFAMGRSSDERWAPEVMQELYSADPAMRYEAARACGKLALQEAAPILIELVEDVDAEVQEAAIWALGQIGGDEARRCLTVCSRSRREARRVAAQEALRELEFLHGNLGAFLLFDFLGEYERGGSQEEEEGLW